VSTADPVQPLDELWMFRDWWQHLSYRYELS